MSPTQKPSRFHRALPALLTGAMLAALLFALYRSGLLAKVNSAQALRAAIASTGPCAGVVYFFLQMATVILAPIPSNVAMLAGSLALGFVPGLTIGLSAVFLASLITFCIARKLGREAVQRFIDHSTMNKYLPIIEEKQDMFLFLALLFPFFPDDILCILAGLTDIPLRRYALIVVAARPWGLIFAALVGGGVLSLPIWGWAVIAAASLPLFYFAMKHSARIEARLLDWIGRITPRRGR